MQTKTLAKRLALGVMAALVSVSLLAGCGGGKDKGAGAQNDPPKIEIPAREPVSTAPTMTFKFGETEAKVYELTGVDLSKVIRTNKLVTLGDELFFHTDGHYSEDKLQHINKVTIKKETIADLVDLGPSGDIAELATNGKIVIWQTNRKATEGKDKIAIYDGKAATVGGKWSGSPMGDAESGDFMVYWGHELRHSKLEDGNWKELGKVFADDKTAFPDFKDTNISLKTVCVSKGDIFMRYFVEKEGGNIPYLIAFNKDGKELCRYEGIAELPRGWAVTENYVVHTGSKGAIRVFDRKTGKVLGDATIDMRPFALWTKTGNDVIVYDDRSHKIYRIDL